MNIAYISRLPETPPAWPRGIAVMGCTGSIGVNALKILASHPDRFRVAALAGGRNMPLLAGQAAFWRPPHLGVLDDAARAALIPLLPAGYKPEIHVGPEGYATLAALDAADLVLSAQVGAAGLAATHAAAAAGKIIALANKESLVLAGDLIRETCARTGAAILPVDSEHNAIFQCLAHVLTGQTPDGAARLILTASGGPFRGKDAAFLANVTPEMALAHPNWSMGAKISIDSATMMNKGLEVIEAYHLYGLPLERIEVLVHPQSIVHSLVEFADGGLLAQMGPPDMRLAISHCLCWPERLNAGIAPLDLARTAALTFETPDLSVFRCLPLAKEALRRGKGLPIVLNAANEIAVAAFLEKRIPFTGIAALVERAMEEHEARGAMLSASGPRNLEDILLLDEETRRRAAL